MTPTVVVSAKSLGFVVVMYAPGDYRVQRDTDTGDSYANATAAMLAALAENRRDRGGLAGSSAQAGAPGAGDAGPHPGRG